MDTTKHIINSYDKKKKHNKLKKMLEIKNKIYKL